MHIATRLTIVLTILVMLGAKAPSAPYPREQMAVILLPINTTQVNGAFGTTWWTDGRVHNQSDKDVPFHIGHSFCGIAFCEEAIPAGRTRADLLVPQSTNWRGDVLHGGLAYVDRSLADQLTFSYHTWVSVAGHARPVAEVPVVKEEDFATGPVVLPHVPLGPTSRVTLRIYDAEPNTGNTVILRIYPAGNSSITGNLLVEQRFQFNYEGILSGDGFDFPRLPGSIQLEALRNRYPSLAPHDAIRIEVAPVDGETGLALWAFATLTDNTTNAVVNYTPNRAGIGATE